MNKVEYLAQVYPRLHKGIKPHVENLTEANITNLNGFDFAFVCIDAGPDKKHIVNFLMEAGVSFVDTGLGIEIGEQSLVGSVRATTVTKQKKDHLARRMPMLDLAKGQYATNIQIAELNMLNAVMAVMKWKKLAGFYADFGREHHNTYTIETNSFLSEETHP